MSRSHGDGRRMTLAEARRRRARRDHRWSAMTIEEYNAWRARGYASFTTGEDVPPDATTEQVSAWRDGLNAAVEEDESDDYP